MGVTNGVSRRWFLTNGIPGGLVAAYTVLNSLDDVFAEEVKVDTFVNNGPSELRYDLLWLPEGYTDTAKEQTKFKKDVDAIVAASEKRKFFKEYGNLINWHRIWVPSENVWKMPGGNGTAFNVEHKKTSVSVNEKQRLSDLSGKTKTDLPCVLINASNDVGYTRREILITDLNVDLAVHELGHGIGGLDDEYTKTNFKGINVSLDEKNSPWISIDGKVNGIKTCLAKDADERPIAGYFKGEEGECLMGGAQPGLDYGILCTNGMILGLRKKIGMIASAPQEGLVSIKKGAPVGIALETLASRTYMPTVRAWYASGTPDEMDALANQLRAGKLEFDAFADKKYKPATVSNQKNKATLTDKLPAGSHVMIAIVKDSNPAIYLDPEKVTVAQRVYRLDAA